MKRILIPLVAVFALLFLLDQSAGPNLSSEQAKYEAFIKNHPYTLRNKNPEYYENLPKYDRPDLAAEHNFLMTLDPALGRVPSERIVAAYEEAKINAKKVALNNRAIQNVEWVERGPDNVGGRTRSLMWDPNDPNTTKVWAGSVSGGLWFNDDITDANSPWTLIDDFLASLSISSITYDPTDSDIYYVATGEGYIAGNGGGGVSGVGLYKSIDRGENWELLPSTLGPNFRFIQKVIVTDEGTVLISTRESLNEAGQGGIYRSIDDGDSWTRVFDGRAGDMELANNGDIYAAIGIGLGPDGIVLRSVDDGESWTDITPEDEGTPRRIELAIADSESSTTETTVVYAVAQNDNAPADVVWFKKTSDGGTTWVDLDIPEYREQNCITDGRDFTRGQAFYNLILSVKPTDSEVVVMGGINVLKSADGGENMAEVSYWTGGCDAFVHADLHEIVFRPGFPDEAVFGHDGGVSYSVDIGSSDNPSFETMNKDYRVTQFYSVAMANESGSGYMLAGSQDNGTQQFTDLASLSTSEATGGDGGFTHIDQTDSDFQLTSFTRNSVNHSSNGGASFVRIESTDAGLFINPTDLDNETHIFYSAGDNNELLRIKNINSTSPDDQEVLSLNGIGQVSHINAGANQTNRIFIGNNVGGIFRIDSAHTESPIVTSIKGNIPVLGFVSSIDVGLNDDQLIATYSNYGITSVWVSLDGGVSWSSKDEDGHGLPDIPIRWALFNPNNVFQVLLATELGIWSTDNIFDDNPGWEPTVTNLANVRCDMLQYRESDSNVAVATFGRGVYTTDAFANSTSGLAPPTNLVGVVNADSVELSWDDNSDDELNFIIDRRLGLDSNFEEIAVLDQDVTAFTDKNLLSNTRYFYSVRAANETSVSTPSNSLDFLTLPEPPTITGAINVNGGIRINWDAVNNVNRFQLDLSQDNFETFVEGFENVEVNFINSFVLRDIIGGVYQIRVRSVNDTGVSEYSDTGILEIITSINETIEQTFDITAYPNPVENILTLQLPTGLVGAMNLTVTGLDGSLVVDSQINSFDTEIKLDMRDLQSGMYLITIQNDVEFAQSRFIKL